MNVKINGKATELTTELSVSDLLTQQDVESPDMVAVQLNGTILDKENFATSTVQEGDQVEFLYFMGGGE
jgi:sulfur carrier protein